MSVSFPARVNASSSPPVDKVRVPTWALALVPLLFGLLYVALQDNGAVLAGYAEFVHELTHDARHALGAPCH